MLRIEADDGVDSAPVIWTGSRRVGSSFAIFETIVHRRPGWATVDPYYKLIDRERDDNVGRVLHELAPAPPSNE